MSAPVVGWAQEPSPLTLRQERMNRARGVEEKAIQTKDSLLLAEAWYLYGKTYVFAGDFRVAQRYFLKSLRIQEPRGDSFELSRLYVRLSETESTLGDLRKALSYARLALRVARRIRSDKALIRAYGGLGRIYENLWSSQLSTNQAKYDSVLFCYQKVQDLCYALHDTAGIAESYINLGGLRIRMKNPQAIPDLKKALTIFTKKNKEGIRVNTMVYLASAYLAFDKPDSALQTLRRARQFYTSRRLKEYDVLLNLERKFVDYFRITGQWKRAFTHIGQLNQLERNQLLANQDGAISRLNIEYETRKKEALLKAQTAELSLRMQHLQTQQRFTLAMSALFMIAVGMSVVLFRLNRKNGRISRQNVDLVKEQNHRVKNSLQVVSSLLSLQSKRLTDETARKAINESRLRVESMAIVHRRLYDGDKLAEVDLDEFIRELTQGVLSAFGYGHVEPRFVIDNSRLGADRAIPIGLILNELLTNSCKYAFPGNENPQVYIRCQRQLTKLEFEVADNGTGPDPSNRFSMEPAESKGELAYVDARTEKFIPFYIRREQVDHQDSTNSQANELPAVKPSFGMQLIQAQVKQLAGSCRWGFGLGTELTGTVFSMELNA